MSLFDDLLSEERQEEWAEIQQVITSTTYVLPFMID